MLFVVVCCWQTEVDAVKQQIVSLTLLNSPSVNTHTTVISKRTAEAQKYITSLTDIYHFMMMALNRAIDFRKTTAGLPLMPSHETFQLPQAVEWGVACFADNPSGVKIRVENDLNNMACCPFVISDKDWVTESILTFLSNACKFTTKGDIVLRCSLVRDVTDVDPAAGERRGSASSLLTNLAAPEFSLDIRKVVSFGNDASIYERVSEELMNSHPDGVYYVHIEVEDSGIGVSPDKAVSIFQPFGQGKRQAGGTGLGLFSLAKRMEVIGGRCGVHSRSDGLSGCCFWFSFLYIPDAAAWQGGGNSPKPSLHKQLSAKSASDTGLEISSLRFDNTARSQREMSITTKVGSDYDQSDSRSFALADTSSIARNVTRKVLLVDDSTLILKTTSRMLIKEGFEVETAQNGEDALHLMQSNRYCFVLSDIQMPVMDGLEMTLQIRQHENCSSSDAHGPHHIIGMSANSDTETRDDSLACGMNAFIPKPVRINKLLKHVPLMLLEAE